MTVYILNMVLIIGYGCLFTFLKTKLKHSKLYFKGRKAGCLRLNAERFCKFFMCAAIGLQLLVLLAVRSNTGFDEKTYRAIFVEISNWRIKDFFLYSIEKGYMFLNAIVATVTQNFQWILVVTAVLTIAPLVVSIYKNSSHCMISYLIYIAFFFYFAISGIRQGIAISITLLAVPALKNKQLGKYILIILAATLFHYSAAIMLPVYFIVHIHFDAKKVVCLSTVVGLTYVFADKIFALVAQLLPKYRGTYSTPEGALKYTTGMSWKSMVVCVFVLLILFILRGQLQKLNPKNYVYINMAYCSVLISVFQTKINILDRFPYFLNAYMIFSIPKLIDCANVELIQRGSRHLPVKVNRWLQHHVWARLEDRHIKSITALGIIFFAVLYSLYVLSNNYYGIVPYSSIFSR